jgi:3-oxoacyl-[acyl-carrier protein] reductase
MKAADTNAQNVLIVGASSSIGGEISNLVRSASMRVITTFASTTPDKTDGREDELFLDLRDNGSIDTFAHKLKELAPRIDIAIFLAGMLPGKSLDAYEFSEIDEVMAVNFNGQAKLIMRMLPLLTAKSRLLLFSSISAQRGSFDPIYAASKGALLSLVKSLATALPAGARINAIAPGLIQDSAMYQGMSPERQAHHRNQVPSKQLLRQQDLAKIVFDLCQDHWAHLNGACIDLNGGQHVR